MTFHSFSEMVPDILECHFPWQAMLKADSCCSAHCTGHFMCDKHESFFVAGAILGDFGG